MRVSNAETEKQEGGGRDRERGRGDILSQEQNHLAKK